MSLKKASDAQEVLCSLWFSLVLLQFNLTHCLVKICVVPQIFSINLTIINFSPI